MPTPVSISESISAKVGSTTSVDAGEIRSRSITVGTAGPPGLATRTRASMT